MPNPTAIEWTDYSSNPIQAVDVETGKRGWWCTKVSPGCAYCYSNRFNRWAGNGLDYLPANSGRVRFELKERELEEILKLNDTVDPEHNKVFMCDMTDLFHEGVSDVEIARVWQTMETARRLTFQVLTKRPDRALAWTQRYAAELHRDDPEAGPWPLPNVWVGVSVENQFWADRRIPLLMRTPAAVRFLSCEPLLGPLDLTPWLHQHVPCEARHCPCETYFGYADGEECTADSHLPDPGVDWVIAGGESAGPDNRRLVTRWDAGWGPHVDKSVWVDALRDHCIDRGVPFFWKQWGGPKPKSAGRIVAGREWNQMPILHPGLDS